MPFQNLDLIRGSLKLGKIVLTLRLLARKGLRFEPRDGSGPGRDRACSGNKPRSGHGTGRLTAAPKTPEISDWPADLQ